MLLEKLDQVLKDESRANETAAALKMMFGTQLNYTAKLMSISRNVPKNQLKLLLTHAGDSDMVSKIPQLHHEGRSYRGIKPGTIFRAIERKNKIIRERPASNLCGLQNNKTYNQYTQKDSHLNATTPTQLKVQSETIKTPPMSSFLLRQRVLDLRARLPHIYLDKVVGQPIKHKKECLPICPQINNNQKLIGETDTDNCLINDVITASLSTVQRERSQLDESRIQQTQECSDFTPRIFSKNSQTISSITEELQESSASLYNSRKLHSTLSPGVPSITLPNIDGSRTDFRLSIRLKSKAQKANLPVKEKSEPGQNQNQILSPVKDRAAFSTAQKIEKLLIVQRKYHKGYLIYDPVCHSFFKSLQYNLQTAQNEDDLPKDFPTISANYFAIMNCETLMFKYLKMDPSEEIEIASLSKIVTCMLTILACKKYEIDIDAFKCRVSEEAATMPGTSACLEAGDILSLKTLLYALMLPSGNDAAIVIAENVGRMIQRHKKKPFTNSPVKTFVRQMNIFYHQMIRNCSPSSEHEESEPEIEHLFQNPSGLSTNPNKTSVPQIMRVAGVAMRNELFKQIVSTKEHQIVVKNQRYGLSRQVVWKNTNKLLWKDWEGVKTGTTETAGHCFIGKYKDYLFGVFDTATMSRRFTDASELMKWMYRS